MEALHYQIALTLVPNVGPKTAKTLISYCGGVEAIFKSSRRSLLKIPYVGEQIIRYIHQKDLHLRAEAEIEYIIRDNIKAYFYKDEHYPARLKHIDDAPLVLYTKGKINFNHSKTIAIIGTRNPTIRGKINGEKLVAALSSFSPLIISGLAYGIDVIAHQSSIKYGLPTIGVVGHSLDTIYPYQHAKIATQMQNNGGLVSEYPSGTKPDGRHFPMRNRLIAGMADAIVVVETAARGGSMITADLATSYHKEVFAFPGRPGDLKSQGCNFLIKNHQAHLIENGNEIAEFLRWNQEHFSQNIQRQLFVELSAKEKKIVALMDKEAPVFFDEISHKLGFNQSILATELLELELKGIIKSIAGKRYLLA